MGLERFFGVVCGVLQKFYNGLTVRHARTHRRYEDQQRVGWEWSFVCYLSLLSAMGLLVPELFRGCRGRL